ncbi:hypothetical protein LEN26_019993 [Aphanomyces euteiches]|nr:hypothetical protein LEN26_019993 [Aphanomyces euteiches]KAH9115653.1 hypothetical protein AeMF1_010330 [Aphanomyces euteiches]KAH9193468.1 hypothetical protein AeNC1_004557 [Aphanomyces euteiches]
MSCMFCNQPALTGKTLCFQHRKKKPCSVPDCMNQVNKKNLCVRHGARKGECKMPDCTNKKLRVGGYCYQHQDQRAAPSSDPETRTQSAVIRCAKRETHKQEYAQVDSATPVDNALLDLWSEFSLSEDDDISPADTPIPVVPMDEEEDLTNFMQDMSNFMVDLSNFMLEQGMISE